MKKWSIKRKIWFAIMMIVVTVILVGIAITMFLYERLYVDKQVQQLMMQGEALAEVYTENGSNDAFAERINWTKQSSDADIIFTEDPMQLGSGAPFAPSSNGDLITFEERQQLLEGETVVMIRAHPQFQQDILGIAIPLFKQNGLAGTIFLSMPLSKVQEPFKHIQLILLFTLVGVVFMIIMIGNKIINDVVQPLNKMKQIATMMAGGDFTKRINERGSEDELGQLARSFNILSSSLEKVENNRREFLANVSHELRTPLSYMKGYTEAIEEGVIQPEKGIAIIQKEANRLERLVNDLLDLAQLEGDSYPLKLEPVAFAQLISDVVDQFELIATKKDIKLLCDLDVSIIIYGDSDRLEQVTRNLLDNAVQYTPPHKSITIRLTKKDQFAQLIISDEGVGIPEDELSAVTERFYRVNKARTRKSGGTGLGLAIVSQIINKHDGIFELSSELNKGTCARLLLKRLDHD